MQAFSTAIVQFFSAITVLFGAFEKGAKTIDNILTVAEEASGAYKDEAKADRAKKAAARARELLADQQNVGIVTDVTAKA
jgi:hypothetical protein